MGLWLDLVIYNVTFFDTQFECFMFQFAIAFVRNDDMIYYQIFCEHKAFNATEVYNELVIINCHISPSNKWL